MKAVTNASVASTEENCASYTANHIDVIKANAKGCLGLDAPTGQSISLYWVN